MFYTWSLGNWESLMTSSLLPPHHHDIFPDRFQFQLAQRSTRRKLVGSIHGRAEEALHQTCFLLWVILIMGRRRRRRRRRRGGTVSGDRFEKAKGDVWRRCGRWWWLMRDRDREIVDCNQIIISLPSELWRRLARSLSGSNALTGDEETEKVLFSFFLSFFPARQWTRTGFGNVRQCDQICAKFCNFDKEI